MTTLKEQFIERLRSAGWDLVAVEREWAAVEAGDRLDECPLKAAGLRLETFAELPTIIIGADGKCICTKADRCLNIDRRDGCRCTIEDLRRLDSEAISRRARQSGLDW